VIAIVAPATRLAANDTALSVVRAVFALARIIVAIGVAVSVGIHVGVTVGISIDVPVRAAEAGALVALADAGDMALLHARGVAVVLTTTLVALAAAAGKEPGGQEQRYPTEAHPIEHFLTPFSESITT
jgi:hypothetical protein